MIAEREPQIVIDLLEHDFIAEEAFVQIPADAVPAGKALGKWFPDPDLTTGMHPEDGFAAGDVGRFGDLVVGVVGKQSEMTVLTSCS